MSSKVYISGVETQLLDSADMTNIDARFAANNARIGKLEPTSLNFRKPFEIYMHQGLASNSKQGE